MVGEEQFVWKPVGGKLRERLVRDGVRKVNSKNSVCWQVSKTSVGFFCKYFAHHFLAQVHEKCLLPYIMSI